MYCGGKFVLQPPEEGIEPSAQADDLNRPPLAADLVQDLLQEVSEAQDPGEVSQVDFRSLPLGPRGAELSDVGIAPVSELDGAPLAAGRVVVSGVHGLVAHLRKVFLSLRNRNTLRERTLSQTNVSRASSDFKIEQAMARTCRVFEVSLLTD